MELGLSGKHALVTGSTAGIGYGEVVATTFNRIYPLIRFGTGDMSAVLSGPSPEAWPTTAR